MAARIEYTKELKRQVLKEISDGANIEDVSKRYEVPVVVIEEWLKRERTETYINAVFLNTHEHHTSKFTSVKESVNSVVAWVKAKALMGGLLAGCLCVATLSFVFNGSAEFSPKLESKVDLAPKLDSLIIQGSKIENTISRQNELSLSISNTVTNILEAQKPKIIVRSTKNRKPVQATCCCCAGIKCSSDFKCKKDTIR